MFVPATVLALSIVLTPAPQAAPPPAAPAVVVILDGGPAKNVDVFVFLKGAKYDVTANLATEIQKFRKGTAFDVYQRDCGKGRLEVLLLPAGEQFGADEKDCYKLKEPVPGAACRCGWIGGFTAGATVTIDLDNGRVKV